MRITNLKIWNFRAFPTADLAFSPGINLLVGSNNAGKSTLLRALSFLQPFDGPFTNALRIGKQEGKVRIEAALQGHESLSGGVLADQVGMGNGVALSFIFNFPKVRQTVVLNAASPEFQSFPNEHPGNVLVPHMSDRRTFAYAEQVSRSNANSITGTHQHVVSRIDQVHGSRQLRVEYERACMSVLGFVPTPHPSDNGKMIGLEVDARSGQRIPLKQLGTGVVQAAALIADLTLMREKIFLVEEPESDLHPKALRALLELIVESAKDGNQFFISTHSNIVVRCLGSQTDAKIFEISQDAPSPVPTSIVREVPATPEARLALLRTLGYELGDFELYDSFLILEESSAEYIIEEFLVPWFAPGLQGRLRTVAASGADDIEPRLSEFIRLLVFVHLQPVYKSRTWVLADGDEKGLKAIQSLKTKFSSWPVNRFQNLSQGDFEYYYPKIFDDRTKAVLALIDTNVRRSEKAKLVRDVGEWLRKDPSAKDALSESANEVIEALRAIEAHLASKESALT